MAEDLGKALLELSTTDKGLEAGLRKARGSAERLESSFGRVSAAVITMNQGFALAERIAGPMARGFMAVVNTADRFDKLARQLSRVTGSTEKAADAQQFLIDTARRVPVSVDALSDALVKFEAVGLDRSRDTLLSLVDGVAAFGGSTQEFRRAVVAIQQMAGKGVISMEELRQQLGEAVPTAIQLMAKELGFGEDRMQEFFKLVESGSLDAQTGISALTRAMKREFGGAASDMMETFSGQVARLNTEWSLFLKALGDTGVLQLAIDAVKQLSNTMLVMVDTVKLLRGELVDALSVDLTALSEGALRDVIRRLENMIQAGKDLGVNTDELAQRLAIAKGQLVSLEVATEETRKATEALTESLAGGDGGGGGLADEFKESVDQANEWAKQASESIVPTDALGVSIEHLSGVQLEALNRSTDWVQFQQDELIPTILDFTEKIKDHAAGIQVVIDQYKKVIPLADRMAAAANRAGRNMTTDFGTGGTAGPSGRNALRDLYFGGRGTAATQSEAPSFSIPGLPGIGGQAAGQVAGVSGALQGAQAGGPLGAAAGFGMALLLKNEKMQQVLQKLSDVMVQLVDPIAEAIAPTLRELVPIIKELSPVFKLIGQALSVYLAPILAQLRAVTHVIRELSKFVKLQTKSLKDLESAATAVTDWLKSMRNALQDVIDAITKIGGGGGFSIPGLQHGGEAIAGAPHIVGERGPELFIPRVSGTVIPNHALSSAPPNQVTVRLEGSESSTFSKRQVRRLIETIRREMADDSTMPRLQVV